MKINTYLINLDDSKERLQQATEQLHDANIFFERVSAFDGRGINPNSIKEYDEKASLAYMGRVLKGGELGCHFSHLDCVKQFLTSDADYALVLEDDMTAPVTLIEDIRAVLTYLTTQPIAWYLINIGANKNKISTRLQQFSSHTLFRAHYFPMTTTGIIWSRQGAQAFYEHTQSHTVFCPIDNFFRHWLTKNNKGLSVYPPLTPPSGAESEIDISASQKRKHSQRHRLYGLIKQRRLWGDKIKASIHKYIR